jgi:hypothetical protein
MRKQNTSRAFVAIFLLAAGAWGQMASPGVAAKYLESRVANVKPEKWAEFDEIVKKMANANHHHKGDTWLASAVAFGPGHVVTFMSARVGLGSVEEGQRAFMRALTEAFGTASATKLLRDFDNCVTSVHATLWRMRPAASPNAPTDDAGLNKLIGQSRWVWSSIEHVGPGHGGDYAAQLQKLKEGIEKLKSASYYTVFISQSLLGERSNTFLATRFGPNLETFEKGEPVLREVFGEEGAKKFHEASAALISSAEISVSQFLPELSNPPEEIAAVDPNFWRPKPPPAAGKSAKDKTKP